MTTAPLADLIAKRNALVDEAFTALDVDASGSVELDQLATILEDQFGIDLARRDVREVMDKLRSDSGGGDLVTREAFAVMMGDPSNLLRRALTGKLAIPDFVSFCADLVAIHHSVMKAVSGRGKPLKKQQRKRGHLPEYIPQLAEADPNHFAFSVCTVDGQQFSYGNAVDVQVPLQGCCTPFLYLRALEVYGEEFVHTRVGRQPSGKHFDSMELDEDGKPHNPLANAGAIVISSMLSQESNAAERFDSVHTFFRRVASTKKNVGFANSIFLSERETAFQNRALTYHLRDRKALHVRHRDKLVIGKERPRVHPTGPTQQQGDHHRPVCGVPSDPDSSSGDDAAAVNDEDAYNDSSAEVESVLDLYTQCCALQANTATIAAMAATLAAGGTSPLSGERCAELNNVKNVLSMMYTCGMFESSGRWAFRVGLPAKSGISGCLMLVVPGVMGMAFYSPLVDQYGHSVNSTDFCIRLVERFQFAIFDQLVGESSKIDATA